VVIFNLFCEVRLDFHSIGDTGVDLEGINIFEALKKRENHSILMLKLMSMVVMKKRQKS